MLGIVICVMGVILDIDDVLFFMVNVKSSIVRLVMGKLLGKCFCNFVKIWMYIVL